MNKDNEKHVFEYHARIRLYKPWYEKISLQILPVGTLIFPFLYGYWPDHFITNTIGLLTALAAVTCLTSNVFDWLDGYTH